MTDMGRMTVERMTVEQTNVVSSLQSMRDRMMRELPKKYGDGFDGDMDTLLEAIRSIKTQATILTTLRAELDGLRAEVSGWRDSWVFLKENNLRNQGVSAGPAQVIAESQANTVGLRISIESRAARQEKGHE